MNSNSPARAPAVEGLCRYLFSEPQGTVQHPGCDIVFIRLYSKYLTSHKTSVVFITHNKGLSSLSSVNENVRENVFLRVFFIFPM